MSNNIASLLAAIQSDLQGIKLPVKHIGQRMQSGIAANFRAKGRYDPGVTDSLLGGGTAKWKALADSTKKGYKKKKWTTDPTLSRTAGGLRSSITVQTSGNTITISANKDYAAIHQFGGQAGKGLKTTIPARPYLVLQQQDIDDIRTIIINESKL